MFWHNKKRGPSYTQIQAQHKTTQVQAQIDLLILTQFNELDQYQTWNPTWVIILTQNYPAKPEVHIPIC